MDIQKWKKKEIMVRDRSKEQKAMPYYDNNNNIILLILLYLFVQHTRQRRVYQVWKWILFQQLDSTCIIIQLIKLCNNNNNDYGALPLFWMEKVFKACLWLRNYNKWLWMWCCSTATFVAAVQTQTYKKKTVKQYYYCY